MSGIQNLDFESTSHHRGVFNPLVFSLTSDQRDSTVVAGDPTRFTIRLSPPVSLSPYDVHKIELVSASIPYVMPNISGNFTPPNNVVTVQIVGVNGGLPFNIILEEGLYGIDELAAAINLDIFNQFPVAANDPLSNPFISLQAIYGTSKVVMIIKRTGQITFGAEFGDIIGFDAGTYADGGFVPYYLVGQKDANFTDISAIGIHCNLCTGSYLDGRASDLMYIAQPDVAPGSLIQVQPDFPVPVLLGKTNFNEITINLTDQIGRPITTLQNQPYSIIFKIDRLDPPTGYLKAGGDNKHKVIKSFDHPPKAAGGRLRRKA